MSTSIHTPTTTLTATPPNPDDALRALWAEVDQMLANVPDRPQGSEERRLLMLPQGHTPAGKVWEFSRSLDVTDPLARRSLFRALRGGVRMEVVWLTRDQFEARKPTA